MSAQRCPQHCGHEELPIKCQAKIGNRKKQKRKVREQKRSCVKVRRFQRLEAGHKSLNIITLRWTHPVSCCNAGDSRPPAEHKCILKPQGSIELSNTALHRSVYLEIHPERQMLLFSIRCVCEGLLRTLSSCSTSTKSQSLSASSRASFSIPNCLEQIRGTSDYPHKTTTIPAACPNACKALHICVSLVNMQQEVPDLRIMSYELVSRNVNTVHSVECPLRVNPMRHTSSIS